MLGVTRPTVVKLLESGAIPYMRVGTHRRVDLTDALRYRDSRREKQYQFIADTVSDDEQPLTVEKFLRNEPEWAIFGEFLDSERVW